MNEPNLPCAECGTKKTEHARAHPYVRPKPTRFTGNVQIEPEGEVWVGDQRIWPAAPARPEASKPDDGVPFFPEARDCPECHGRGIQCDRCAPMGRARPKAESLLPCGHTSRAACLPECAAPSEPTGNTGHEHAWYGTTSGVLCVVCGIERPPTT